MYFLMKGTPFIYQGQEIGMTNVYFDSIEDYDDVAARNLYKDQLEDGISEEDILYTLGKTSRDNSRTPMQWSSEKNAGFSTGKPWLKVNKNYPEINVEKQLQEKDSILQFYKDMIQLKKDHKIFTYGSYDLLLDRKSTRLNSSHVAISYAVFCL